jgi:hypothetical protein
VSHKLVPTQFARLLVIAGLTLCAPLGCKDKDGDSPAAEEVKVLEAPANGSPVAAQFVKFTGEGDERGMEVLLYNTGDKTAASYILLFRYFDADDNILKVKPGTPFEKDSDFTSMSGGKYKCEPSKNKTLQVDHEIVAVPAAAVRAEILLSKVGAIASDGKAIEDWWSQENFSEWPAG